VNNLEDSPLKLKITSLAIAGVLFGTAAVPAQAGESMNDLLKVLRDNGTISATDYELLVNAAKADEEKVNDAVNRVAKVEEKSSSLKNLSWAEKIKIKGDVRFRYENRNQESEGESSVQNTDRLRVRARVGVYADVNDQVKAGMRFVSTANDATSTNESLDDNFESSNLGWDLAYIDWAPTALGGNQNFVFGKMKQPWVKVNDMVWDGDTNPEGAVYKGKFKLDGFTLMPSIGYYALGGDVNSGDSIFEDSYLFHTQLAAKIGKIAKVGVSYYGFENEEGFDTDGDGNYYQREEELWEVFASSKIPGTPLTVYGSYVTNANDTDRDLDELPGAGTLSADEDAFSLGVKAKLGAYKAGYEYRDTGINAVNPYFDNSDFQDNSKGHILKAGYKIDKNFSLGATYFITERNTDDRERERFQLDLKVKY
jgi:hypothetical protein